MEAILKFNLPEEREEFSLASKAQDLHSLISEFSEFLRRRYKHQEQEPTTPAMAIEFEEIRTKWHELVTELAIEI